MGKIPRMNDEGLRDKIKEANDKLKGKFDAAAEMDKRIKEAENARQEAWKERDAAFQRMKGLGDQRRVQVDGMKAMRNAGKEKSAERKKMYEQIEALGSKLPYGAPHDAKSPQAVADHNLAKIREAVAKLEKEREQCHTPGEDRAFSKRIQREEAQRSQIREYLEEANALMKRLMPEAAAIAEKKDADKPEKPVDLEKLKADEDAARATYVELKAKYDALKAAVDKLRADRKKISDSITEMKKSRDAMSSRLDKLRKEHKAMADRIKAEEAERAKKLAEERAAARAADAGDSSNDAAKPDGGKKKKPLDAEITVCRDAIEFLRPMLPPRPKKGKKAPDLLVSLEPHQVKLFKSIGVEAPGLSSEIASAIKAVEEKLADYERRSEEELAKRESASSSASSSTISAPAPAPEDNPSSTPNEDAPTPTPATVEVN